jgi:hypothetical protein
MPAVVEHGVDTWRLARRLDRDADLERARALMPAGRFPEKVAGHVVGLLPGHRMLWIEGHPAVEGLAHPAALASAEGSLLEALDLAGIPTGRDLGIARLDGTVTLGGYDARALATVLSGSAALDVPRMKPVVYGKPPQTVYLQGHRSRSVHGRLYNKSAEQGLVGPEQLLRFEDQRRFTKETRRSVTNVEPGEDFARRFAAMARSAAGVRAMTLPTLSRELAERVNTGEITDREAERLVGFLALHHAGARRFATRTLERRRRELRDRGLVLADAFYEPVSVDLAEPFEAALAAWEAL